MSPGSPLKRLRTVTTLSVTALAVSSLAALHYWRARIPPSLLASRSTFQRLDAGTTQLLTTSLGAATRPSFLLAAAGRGDIAGFAENRPELSGRNLDLLGGPHPYARWENSGTALYGLSLAAGAESGGVRLLTAPHDEATLMAVQVAGSRISDLSWVERPPAWQITSGSVTTRGAATLVAFWWGDAGVRYRKRVLPGSGFRLLDGVLESGALVQAASAVRHVDRAGTYSVTWTAWPKQGGQLWLVAIE